mgnify:CR=1 FL=1|eukprot:scaffold34055_cov33-Tisochrysis_lutea.AAC.2
MSSLYLRPSADKLTACLTPRETKASVDDGEIDSLRQADDNYVHWVPRGMPPMPPLHRRFDIPRYQWVPGGLRFGDQPGPSDAWSFISNEAVLPTLPEALASQQPRWAYDETADFAPTLTMPEKPNFFRHTGSQLGWETLVSSKPGVDARSVTGPKLNGGLHLLGET